MLSSLLMLLYYALLTENSSGGIVHLEAFGQHVLVLNTQEACSDLLDKRSLNYSDRALTPVMTSSASFPVLPFYLHETDDT